MRAMSITVVRRAGDGLVQIAAVSDVPANIQLIQSFGVQVDSRFSTRPSRRAQAIVSALRARYHHASIDGGPWYAIDFFQAREAVLEYDLDTGERAAAGVVGLKSTVYVEGFGVGKVSGFSPCGRVEVTFERSKHAALKTYAPASQVAVVA